MRWHEQGLLIVSDGVRGVSSDYHRSKALLYSTLFCLGMAYTNPNYLSYLSTLSATSSGNGDVAELKATTLCLQARERITQRWHRCARYDRGALAVRYNVVCCAYTVYYLSCKREDLRISARSPAFAQFAGVPPAFGSAPCGCLESFSQLQPSRPHWGYADKSFQGRVNDCNPPTCESSSGSMLVVYRTSCRQVYQGTGC